MALGNANTRQTGGVEKHRWGKGELSPSVTKEVDTQLPEAVHAVRCLVSVRQGAGQVCTQVVQVCKLEEHEGLLLWVCDPQLLHKAARLQDEGGDAIQLLLRGHVVHGQGDMRSVVVPALKLLHGKQELSVEDTRQRKTMEKKGSSSWSWKRQGKAADKKENRGLGLLSWTRQGKQ